MSGLWHLTTQSAQDCMPEPYPSPETVAYYGHDTTCTFSTIYGNIDSLARTASIAGITSNSLLTFVFVNVHKGSILNDYVDVSTNGSIWTEVWRWAAPQQTTWTYAGLISLSPWAGESIYIRFRFDSTKTSNRNYLGWAVDNIQVTDIL